MLITIPNPNVLLHVCSGEVSMTGGEGREFCRVSTCQALPIMNDTS